MSRWSRIRNTFKHTSFINVIALIASILAGFISSFAAIQKISEWVFVHIFGSKGSLNLFISNAFAQGASTSFQIGSVSIRDIFPPLMILGVFMILLACIYIVAFGSATKTTNDKAWDMIKIIAGFFIGNLTSLLK